MVIWLWIVWDKHTNYEKHRFYSYKNLRKFDKTLFYVKIYWRMFLSINWDLDSRFYGCKKKKELKGGEQKPRRRKES